MNPGDTSLWDRLMAAWLAFPEFIRIGVLVVMVVVAIVLCVAILTLLERKVIGWMQARIGPNRVNIPFIPIPGLGQPFADVFKLLFKEIILPQKAARALFLAAPIVSMAAAFGTWAVVPFSPEFVFADVNAGLLYILALTSMGVYGIIIAGWATNSKYAFLGAMRSAAQMVSYEIAMGFALVGVLMAAGSLNMSEIVQSQAGGALSWNWFWLLPLLFVYFISGVAETNRAPFDVAEGESEIVAGFHVEYSGAAFATLFAVPEYANMILVALLTSVFFFGGWLSPFDGYLASHTWLAQPSFFWLAFKTSFFLFMYLWLRATFPRYRYDQIMRLGWKVLIPVTLVWLLAEGVMAYFHVGPWGR